MIPQNVGKHRNKMQERGWKKRAWKGEEIKQQRNPLFYLGQQANRATGDIFCYKIKKLNWYIGTPKFSVIFTWGKEIKNGFDVGTWANYHGLNQNKPSLVSSSPWHLLIGRLLSQGKAKPSFTKWGLHWISFNYCRNSHGSSLLAAPEAQETVKHRKQLPFGQSFIGTGNQRLKAKSGPSDLTARSFSSCCLALLPVRLSAAWSVRHIWLCSLKEKWDRPW